jgi:hypothetical protein
MTGGIVGLRCANPTYIGFVRHADYIYFSRVDCRVTLR